MRVVQLKSGRNRTGGAWEANRCRLDGRRHDGLKVTQAAVMEIAAAHSAVHNYAARRGPAAPPRDLVGLVGFGVPPLHMATLQATLLCNAAHFPSDAISPWTSQGRVSRHRRLARSDTHSQKASRAPAGPACWFKIIAVASC